MLLLQDGNTGMGGRSCVGCGTADSRRFLSASEHGVTDSRHPLTRFNLVGSPSFYALSLVPAVLHVFRAVRTSQKNNHYDDCRRERLDACTRTRAARL